MQGMTAEPGLVTHWLLPKRVSDDIKWLIAYVMLSRVPSLKQLISIGLSDKIRDIIEKVKPNGGHDAILADAGACVPASSDDQEMEGDAQLHSAMLSLADEATPLVEAEAPEARAKRVGNTAERMAKKAKKDGQLKVL